MFGFLSFSPLKKLIIQIKFYFKFTYGLNIFESFMFRSTKKKTTILPQIIIYINRKINIIL